MPRRRTESPLLRAALAALILAAVAFAATLLYLALQSSRQTAVPTAENEAVQPTAARLVAPIELSTIEMPNEAERLLHWSWTRYRPPRERWTAEEVDRFWIDPGQIGAEYLSQTNRRLIEELLSEVP